ncbi:8531_t:CDS:2, partial [Paraglomus brasilianum]
MLTGCTTPLGAFEEGWCKKSAEIIDIIWDRSKEIADSKVRLTLSELLTKTNIIGEIGDLGSKSSPDTISAVQPQNEKNRNKHAIREDSQSDDLFKKINEDDEEFLENEFLDTNTIEAFSEYQKRIPKTRKALTPAYWGILDLTKESLKNP